MKNPRGAVRIVEVGPRDGLQNIREPVPTAVKVELIQRLRESGLSAIELTSIVSPRSVPQLADCREILEHQTIRHLQRQQGLRLPVLVPNLKGLDIALDCGATEVAAFVSATEGFSKANINCSVDKGIERAFRVAEKARQNGVAVRGYVSCIFEDPFTGPTEPSAVLHCVRALFHMGCYEVSLGDTLGVGSPEKVRELLNYLSSNGIPMERLAGHFHDTYGHAAANVWEAYTCGLRTFDSSVAGLGGCPFAPGSKGNVASEDLIFMFHNSGIDTGVNLVKLMETGTWVSQVLGTDESRVPNRHMAIKHGHGSRAYVSTSLWEHVQQRGKLSLYRSGSSVKIMLNRTKTGNTLNHGMIMDLTSLVRLFDKDDTVSIIIITGKGRFFCMGVEYGQNADRAGESAELESLSRLLDLLGRSSKMTIASINGPAFGAGVCLALSCDTRISVRTATFTMEETIWSSSREDTPERSYRTTVSARPISTGRLKSLQVIDVVVDGYDQLESLENQICMRSWASRSVHGLAQETSTHADKYGGGVTSKKLLEKAEPRNLSNARAERIHRQHWMQLIRRVWGPDI
ncbi:hypothetical protein BDV59DRAFT_190480 [Aspergillus ambiguus]|uniref:uncharacterized protein n=1 Tax=Aspergillus ambiguus TaxID=176160 RepID=UPI003CCDBE0E